MTSRYWLFAACALCACAARHGFGDEARPDTAVAPLPDATIDPIRDAAGPDASSSRDAGVDAGPTHDVCRIEASGEGGVGLWLEWRLDDRGRFRSVDYSRGFDMVPIHLEVSAWDEAGRATAAETTYEFGPPMRHVRTYLPDGRPLSSRDVGGEDDGGREIDDSTQWIYEAGQLREIAVFNHSIEISRSRIEVDLAARRATLTRDGYDARGRPGTETIEWNPDGTIDTFSAYYPEADPRHDYRVELRTAYDSDGHLTDEHLTTVAGAHTQTGHWTHTLRRVADGVEHLFVGGASPMTGFIDYRTLWLDEGQVRRFTTRDTAFVDDDYLELTGCTGRPVQPRVPWTRAFDPAPYRWAGAPLVEDPESFPGPEIMPLRR